MRQTGSPGVKIPELHAALAAYLANLPAPAPEPEVLVQDELPGLEAPGIPGAHGCQPGRESEPGTEPVLGEPI
jgi:hypothetical protein